MLHGTTARAYRGTPAGSADPVMALNPKGIHMPCGGPGSVRWSSYRSFVGPSAQAESEADPQPSLGAARPKPKAFAGLRRDAALEEPIEVFADSPSDPIEEF